MLHVIITVVATTKNSPFKTLFIHTWKDDLAYESTHRLFLPKFYRNNIWILTFTRTSDSGYHSADCNAIKTRMSDVKKLGFVFSFV